MGNKQSTEEEEVLFKYIEKHLIQHKGDQIYFLDYFKQIMIVLDMAGEYINAELCNIQVEENTRKEEEKLHKPKHKRMITLFKDECYSRLLSDPMGCSLGHSCSIRSESDTRKVKSLTDANRIINGRFKIHGKLGELMRTLSLYYRPDVYSAIDRYVAARRAGDEEDVESTLAELKCVLNGLAM